MPTSRQTPRRSSGRQEPPDSVQAEALASPATRAGLIALMVIGSVLMCPVVPVGMLYLVSQLQDSTQPSLGPYVLVFVLIVAAMVAIGKALGMLDRYYARRTGNEDERRRAAWLQSMRGERRPTTSAEGGVKVLDTILLWSIGTASLAFGVWFVFFAGASI